MLAIQEGNARRCPLLQKTKWPTINHHAILQNLVNQSRKDKSLRQRHNNNKWKLRNFFHELLENSKCDY